MQMLLVRYHEAKIIEPFEILGSECHILNTSLAEIQSNEVRKVFSLEHSILDVPNHESLGPVAQQGVPMLAFASNLFFNAELFNKFLQGCQKSKQPSTSFQAVLPAKSKLVRDFIAPLQDASPEPNQMEDKFFPLPLFYFKGLPEGAPFPISIPVDETSIWYLALPPKTNDSNNDRTTFTHYALSKRQDLAPIRTSVSTCIALPIRHWVHLLTANIVFGLFGDSLRFSKKESLMFFPNDSLRGSKPLQSIRDLVLIGDNCQIDPTAIIIGPTILGDEVIVEPNASVVASVVGKGSVIGQSSNVRLSVVGERTTFPPPSSSALWSVVLGDALINNRLRFSVVGQGAFIGGAVWITDRVLGNKAQEEPDDTYGGHSVRVRDGQRFADSGYWVLGAAIGNRSKLGSGLVIYPGRTIPADSVIHLGDGVTHTMPISVVK